MVASGYISLELVLDLHREAQLTGLPVSRALGDGTFLFVDVGDDPATLYRAKLGVYVWEDPVAHRRFVRRSGSPESIDRRQCWIDARIGKLELLFREDQERTIRELAQILRGDDYRTSHWELVVRAWARANGVRLSKSVTDDLIRRLVAYIKFNPSDVGALPAPLHDQPAPVRRRCA